ncbi:MAG TPA: site-2 protease family protein [Longimicrobium sp.]|jgi:Zn-dependent protease/CBS domain-containing protein
MQANVRLLTVRGIPIGVHWSWLIVFGLVTWSLAADYGAAGFPQLGPGARWLLALVTAALFFTSVVLHELGHAVVAQRNGVPVRSITLFVFGGVAAIGREPPSAGAEFRIAAAGPAVSFALAALFAGLHLLARPWAPLAALGFLLAWINLSLAVFNLVPGYPLDGGRILRSIIWKVTGDPHRATRASAFLGQLVAFAMMGMGLWRVVRGDLNGAWLVFLGWFLQNAAASSVAQSALHQELRGVTVGQLMSPRVPIVAPGTTLRALVEERILRQGERRFLVDGAGRVYGLLTLRDVTRVPQAEWPSVTVEQVMVPWERVLAVVPNTGLWEALEMMETAGVGQVPVVAEGRVIGMLTREDVLRHIRLRAELGLRGRPRPRPGPAPEEPRGPII